MRIIDSKIISDIKVQLEAYNSKYHNSNDYYNNIGKLRFKSLQQRYFKNNIDFIKQVSFIVNIISTIIYNPHRSNKEEETILRREKAKRISIRDFNQTLRDSTLWKETSTRNIEPEFVCSTLAIDNLIIYENQFIVLLIDYICDNIAKMKRIYLNLISVNNIRNVVSNKEDVLSGLAIIEDINRKLLFIKETNFYKEISKAKRIDKTIKPTNILLHDRLYNHCFKFYKEYIVYDDYKDILNVYKNYIVILLLRNLKKYKFIYNNNLFTNKDFIIKLDYDNYDFIDITIKLKNMKKSFTHRLYISINYDFDIIDINNDNLTTSYVTLFNIFDINTKTYIVKNYVSEALTIEKYVKKLILKVKVDDVIYSKYCLSCRKDLELIDDIYYCDNCHSMYIFIDEKYAWILK